MVELLPFFGLVFYLTPFVVAVFRDHDAPVGVLVVNLLLGWTVIGWFAVLAWALVPGRPAPTAAVSQEAAVHDRPRRPVMPRTLAQNPSRSD